MHAQMEQTRVQDGGNVLRQASRVEFALYVRVALPRPVEGPKSRLTGGPVKAVRGRILAGKHVTQSNSMVADHSQAFRTFDWDSTCDDPPCIWLNLLAFQCG